MEDPIVELKTGKIRGLVEKHEDSFDYYAFKGIPYAEPPIGELRFQAISDDGTIDGDVDKFRKIWVMQTSIINPFNYYVKYCCRKPTVEKNELIDVDWIPVKDSKVFDYLNLDDNITMKSTTNFNEKFLAAKNIEV